MVVMVMGVWWDGMGWVHQSEAIKKCHSAIPLTIAILTVPGIRVQCSAVID